MGEPGAGNGPPGRDSVLVWAPQKAGPETRHQCKYFMGSAIPGRIERCRMNRGGGRVSVRACHQAGLCYLGTVSAQIHGTSGKMGEGFVPHTSPPLLKGLPLLLITNSPHWTLSLPERLGCKCVGSKWVSTMQCAGRNPKAGGELRVTQPE